MVKIAYNTSYDQHTGEISFVTDCPYIFGVKVGAGACFRCNYFHAVTMKQQIECGYTAESVLNGLEGVLEPQPYNLSSAKRKPVQTKIQFK